MTDNEWARKLERYEPFKEFLKRLEAMHSVKVTQITNAGSPSKPMTLEQFHGIAGEARTLKTVINLVARAAKQKEPESE